MGIRDVLNNRLDSPLCHTGVWSTGWPPVCPSPPPQMMMMIIMIFIMVMMVMITKTRTTDATLMIDLMEHKLVADSFAHSNSSFFVMMGMPEMIKD